MSAADRAAERGPARGVEQDHNPGRVAITMTGGDALTVSPKRNVTRCIRRRSCFRFHVGTIRLTAILLVRVIRPGSLAALHVVAVVRAVVRAVVQCLVREAEAGQEAGPGLASTVPLTGAVILRSVPAAVMSGRLGSISVIRRVQVVCLGNRSNCCMVRLRVRRMRCSFLATCFRPVNAL